MIDRDIMLSRRVKHSSEGKLFLMEDDELWKRGLRESIRDIAKTVKDERLSK